MSHGLLDERCLYDLEWYQKPPERFEPATPARSRRLLEKCLECEDNYSRPTPGVETHWFEPIFIVYHGPKGESFEYAYSHAPLTTYIATRDRWGSFTLLGQYFKKRRLMHFLGARRWMGRAPGKEVVPICLINAPNIYGSEMEIYKRLKDLSDTQLRGHQPYMYITECERLNKRFLESVEEL